jgi:8-oxo-dGTP pyrophosphatase MutT (NUDIX family)
MAIQLFQIATKALIQNNDGDILMFHVPDWGDIPAHWDLPGGRVNENESLNHAIEREIEEELGVRPASSPKQLYSMITNIAFEVDGKRLPLFFVVYKVELNDYSILSKSSDITEDDMQWFNPKVAAENMQFKFDEEFCKLVSNL